jgi:LysR family glycine cleavage system transcriptional activator
MYGWRQIFRRLLGANPLSRRNLHLNGLKAFESAARHLSFKRAADELMVTHTAISYHVRQLEESLGVRLFERNAEGIELTVVGAALQPGISEAFDGIVSALDQLPKFSSKSAIKVTTTPSFASRWLVPRLHKWRALCRGTVDIHLLPTLKVLDLVHDEADIAIRCGVPPWSGLTTHELVPIHMMPICSPQVAKEHPALKPADLLQLTLLHGDAGKNSIGTEWQAWFAAAGVMSQKRLPGLSFKDPSLSWQAAINGLGFAIGYEELIGTDLASSGVVKVFDVAVRHPFSYYLVYPNARKRNPKITEFVKWITAECQSNNRDADDLARRVTKGTPVVLVERSDDSDTQQSKRKRHSKI